LTTTTTKTYLQAISDGLREEMRRDGRVFLIGEDIGVYGGAFKVTQGFLQEFGEDRVIDSPLSETAIVGSCTGAALMGMRPVCEMQFSDFVSCAFDQLVTVAAKQHYRVGTPVPIVVRLPSGGGFSGGPFHSQNPEGFFAHCPGLKIACPATPADAKGLIVQAIRDPNPVLFFEHKHLYRRIKGEVPDGEHAVELGKARLHREGSDLSIITYGAMVYTAEEAAQLAEERDGTSVEIVDLRTVTPWDRQAVLESAAKTSKVIVLHEDTHTSGFGAEIAATIAEEAFEDLDGPVLRVTSPDTPVPFSPPLEKAFLPQTEDVLAAIDKLASY
jgi:pyruvate/2-oxoglutarate/acetoin dehydrogenase E1 component